MSAITVCKAPADTARDAMKRIIRAGKKQMLAGLDRRDADLRALFIEAAFALEEMADTDDLAQWEALIEAAEEVSPQEREEQP